MPEFTTLIAGHSHSSALGFPLTTADGKPALAPIAQHPSMAGLSGAYPRDDAYWAELVSLCRGRSVVLVWRGNQHLTRFLFAPRPRVDFVLSSRTDLPIARGAVLVPELKVRQYYEESMPELAALLKQLRAGGAARVIVCGTPPPKGDDRFIRGRLRTERTFARIARHLGIDVEQAPLAPPLVRYKHWALLQDCMRRTAVAEGAGFLPSPAAALTEKFGLARPYWRADVSHANDAYGTLVLGQLEALNGKAHASV